MSSFATLALDADSRGLDRGVQSLDAAVASGERAAQAADKASGGFTRTGRAANDMSRPVRRATDDLDRMRSVMGNVATYAGRMAAGLLGAFGVGSLFAGAVREAETLERNMLRLNAVIDATGGIAGRSAQQLHAQARELARGTLASTEGIMEAQRVLLTFRNVRGEVFDQAIEGALDLAEAMGTNVTSATMQLARALEDPIQGITALTRSGTVFTAAQRDMVREMVETGRVAEAQRFILGELAAQYGGVAAAAAGGLAGAQDTLKQSVQEALIAFNEQLRLTDRMATGLNALSAVVQAAADNMERLVHYAGVAGVAGMIAMRGAIVAATTAAWGFVASLVATRAALARTGVGLLVVGLGELAYRMDAFGLRTDTARGALDAATQSVRDHLHATADLTTRVRASGTVSLDRAQALLAEAEAQRAATDAAIAYRQEIALQESGILESIARGDQQIARLMEVIERFEASRNSLNSERIDAELEPFIQQLERAQQTMRQLQDRQREITSLTRDEVRAREEASGIISVIQTAIDRARNGMVRLGDAANGANTAATGLRDAAEDVSRQLGLAWQNAGGLTGALGQAVAQAQNLSSWLSQIPGALAGASSRIAGLQAGIAALDGGGDRLTASVAQYRAELEASLPPLETMQDGQRRFVREQLERQVALFEQEQRLGQAYRDRVSELNQVARAAGGGGGGAAAALNEAQQAAEGWVRRLNTARTPMQRFRSDLAEINALHRAGALSAEDHAAAVALITDETAQSIPIVNDLANAWADFVVGGFRDFQGFVRNVLSSFQNMLREMIATAARNRIMISKGIGGGGVAGTAAQAGSSIMGGGGGLLSGLLGSFGSTGGGILGGLGGGTGFLGGLGNALSGGLGNMFAIGSNAAAAGGGFLATMGAAAPILGIAALAIGAFMKSTRELDRGIRVTTEGVDTLVESFRKVETRRLFGLIRSRSTSVTPLDDAEAEPMRAAVREIQMGILDAAEVLGIGADAFADFAHSIEVSTKDMTDEQAMQAVIGALEGMADAFAGMVISGPNAAETIMALATSLTTINHVMDTLGLGFRAVGLSGAEMALAIAEAAGGLDAYAASADRFFQLFYSEEERRATLTRQVTAQLGELNLMMPRSRQELRGMVEMLDLTTQGGREAHAALLGLSETFDFILPQIEGLTQAAAELQGVVGTQLDGMIAAITSETRASLSAAREWQGAARSLRDFVARLQGTAGALVTPQGAFEANMARFERLVAGGMAGDGQAVRDLPRAADTLISSARDVARDAVDLARVEARVLRDMRLMSGVADVEQMRHEAIAHILEAQSGVLEEVRDFMRDGGVLNDEMIGSLNAELSKLEDAIKAAEMINYAFLRQRMDVAVDLMVDADVPDDVREMLANTARGIERDIDLIFRAEWLTPDERWLALTASSEHLRTVEMVLAGERQWPRDLSDLARTFASDHLRTIRFLADNMLPEDLMTLALGDVSDLLKSIRFTAEALPADVRAVVFNDIDDLLKVVNFRTGTDLPEADKRLALDEAETFLRTIDMVAGRTPGERLQALALDAPAAFRRTLDIVAGRLPSGTATDLALSDPQQFRRIIEFAAGRTITPDQMRLALDTAQQFSRTINLVLGRNIDTDTRRIALASSSELARVVNVAFGRVNGDALRLALGAAGAYSVAIDVAFAPGMARDVRRVVLEQGGAYAAMIEAAVLARDLTPAARRVLLDQQGGYVANVTGILTANMTREMQRLLLDANTTGARAITVAGAFAQGMSRDEREALRVDALTIQRTIRAAVNTAGLSTTGALYLSQLGLGDGSVRKTLAGQVALSSLTAEQRRLLEAESETIAKRIQGDVRRGPVTAEQRQVLMAESETITRTIQGAVSLSDLDNQQRAMLDAITGTSAGTLRLGGSFVFDPSKAFSTWFEATLASGVRSPMDGLRSPLVNLRSALDTLQKQVADDRFARIVTTSALIDAMNYWASQPVVAPTPPAAAPAPTPTPEPPRRPIWKDDYGQFPGFALGGTHRGGPAYIGENDLELVAPSRVYNPSETRAMLDNRVLVEEVRKLRAEIARMREEQRTLGIANNRDTRRMAQTIQTWDVEGLPENES